MPAEKVAGWQLPSAADIATACSHNGVTIDPADVILSEAKIDFAMKARNPLNSVHFFDDHTSQTKYALSDRDMTTMNLNNFQEVLLRVYTRSRDPQHVAALYRAVERWQEKAFGGSCSCCVFLFSSVVQWCSWAVAPTLVVVFLACYVRQWDMFDQARVGQPYLVDQY